MNDTFHADSHHWNHTLLVFLRETALCFVLLTMILLWRHGQVASPSDTWLIRSGMLRDLVAEMPTGRQALVSSPLFMPLSGLAALPFLPFLSPAGYGYAYLYGLAGLLALAALPLRMLLRQWGAGRLPWSAPALLALAAAALGASEYSDVLACLAMLILAIYFERQDLAELRALAGVFWGLVLFAHAAGFALVALRIAIAGGAFLRRRRNAEEKAVNWIQGVCVFYILAAYLFLNWMIMGSWLYPLRTVSWSWPSVRPAPTEALSEALARRCPGRVPVVSGHWGYVVNSLLVEKTGYHLLNFHPAKIPSPETRPLVLVVPAPGNPLARLCDLPPDDAIHDPQKIKCLLLAETRDWRFYLVETASQSLGVLPRSW